MNSKEIKLHLKDIRTKIDQKDFDEALLLCKKVLKSDSTNYMALVFSGVCLQEVGPQREVVQAFKKAIVINENEILAWQGLAKFLEKSATNDLQHNQDLINVYEKLMSLERNTTRLCDISDKLTKLTRTLNDYDKGIDILSKLMKHDNISDTNKAAASEALILLFIKGDVITKADKSQVETLQDTLEAALAQWISFKPMTEISYYQEYMKLLNKRNKWTEVLQVAKQMYKTFPFNVYALEWMCKVFVEAAVELRPFSVETQEELYQFVNRLDILKPDGSASLYFFRAVVLFYQDRNYLAAKNVLEHEVLSKRSRLIHARVLLAQCFLRIHDMDSAIKCATEAQSFIIENKCSSRLQNVLDVIFIECWSSNSITISKAKNIALRLLTDEQVIISLKIIALRNILEVLIKTNDDSVNIWLNHLLSSNIPYKKEWNQICKVQIALQNNDQVINQLDQLERIRLPDDKNDNHVNQLLSDLCKTKAMVLQTVKGDNDDILKALIKASNYTPSDYKCFILLADYYENIGASDETVIESLQRAFNLNKYSPELGIRLCNKLDLKPDKTELYETLCKAMGDNWKEVLNNNVWAWLRAGKLYLSLNDGEKAVPYFQRLIDIYNNVPYYWEMIGDAFLCKKALYNAFNSYDEALKLDCTRLYSSYKIGVVLMMQKEYKKALIAFERVFYMNPNFIPALCGIAEVLYKIALESFQQRFMNQCRLYLQQAFNILQRTLLLRNNLICLWSLVSKCTILGSSLPPKYSYFSISSTVAQIESDTAEDIVVHHLDLFEISYKSLKRALDIAQASNHEKEVSIRLQYAIAQHSFRYGCALLKIHKQQPQSPINPIIIRRYFKEAFVHLYSAFLKPQFKNSAVLQTIAIICAHSHVRQVKMSWIAVLHLLNDRNLRSLIYTVLGALLLDMSFAPFAIHFFKRANVNDFRNCFGWRARALIDYCNTHYNAALNSFNSSLNLKYSYQCVLGAAYCLIHNGLQIAPVKHVLNLSDGLKHYLEMYSMNGCAWNLYGLLLHRLNLKQNALNAFDTSCTLLNKDNENYPKVLFNKCRVLLDMNCYKNVVSLLENETTTKKSISRLYILAKAYYKLKMYKKAYENLRIAFEYSSFHEDQASQGIQAQGIKVQLLFALSAVAFQIGQLEKTKMLLLQCSQQEELSIKNTTALLKLNAVAVLTNSESPALNNSFDPILLSQQSTDYDNKYIINSLKLNVFNHLLNSNHSNTSQMKKSINTIYNFIHSFPLDYNARKFLTEMHLLLSTSAGFQDNFLVLKYICDNQYNTNKEDEIDFNLKCLYCLTHILITKIDNIVTIAQQIFFQNPMNVTCWVLLVSVLDDKNDEQVELKKKLLKMIQEYFPYHTNKYFSNWFQNFQ